MAQGMVSKHSSVYRGTRAEAAGRAMFWGDMFNPWHNGGRPLCDSLTP